jgi:hypothetical protein
MEIYLTKEEIQDVLSNLEQCESEGYLNFGDPAFEAMKKLEEALQQIKYSENFEKGNGDGHH